MESQCHRRIKARNVLQTTRAPDGRNTYVIGQAYLGLYASAKLTCRRQTSGDVRLGGVSHPVIPLATGSVGKSSRCPAAIAMHKRHAIPAISAVLVVYLVLQYACGITLGAPGELGEDVPQSPSQAVTAEPPAAAAEQGVRQLRSDQASASDGSPPSRTMSGRVLSELGPVTNAQLVAYPLLYSQSRSATRVCNLASDGSFELLLPDVEFPSSHARIEILRPHMSLFQGLARIDTHISIFTKSEAHPDQTIRGTIRLPGLSASEKWWVMVLTRVGDRQAPVAASLAQQLCSGPESVVTLAYNEYAYATYSGPVRLIVVPQDMRRGSLASVDFQSLVDMRSAVSSGLTIALHSYRLWIPDINGAPIDYVALISTGSPAAFTSATRSSPNIASSWDVHCAQGAYYVRGNSGRSSATSLITINPDQHDYRVVWDVITPGPHGLTVTIVGSSDERCGSLVVGYQRIEASGVPFVQGDAIPAPGRPCEFAMSGLVPGRYSVVAMARDGSSKGVALVSVPMVNAVDIALCDLCQVVVSPDRLPGGTDSIDYSESRVWYRHSHWKSWHLVDATQRSRAGWMLGNIAIDSMYFVAIQVGESGGSIGFRACAGQNVVDVPMDSLVQVRGSVADSTNRVRRVCLSSDSPDGVPPLPWQFCDLDENGRFLIAKSPIIAASHVALIDANGAVLAKVAIGLQSGPLSLRYDG